MTYPHTQLFIDGQWQDAADARTLAVFNPASGQEIGRVAHAGKPDLDRALAAAQKGFETWRDTPAAERSKIMRRAAALMRERAGDIAGLLTQEQGKPLAMAKGEMFGAVATIQGFAAMDLPEKVLKEDATTRIVQRRTPLGVVASITPWNFPMILLMLKVPPALLAGNTVVAKPAPTTPLTTLRFGELCAEILPPGVVNVITDQNDLGDALTSHPDVAKVAFTGSTATGKKVMASVAGTLKRLTLELGGNDAAIVLDDVDPKEIAPKIFNAAMFNTGQVCLAAKRAYIPDAIYDEVCAELAKLADAAVVGNGLAADTQLGPVQNKMQYEKIKGYIADGKARGKIIAGGEDVDGPGYFIRPTIVRDIPDDARLVCEEQFGPVLPVLRYKNLDDAIARANSTDYGLGATVWTSNPERGYEVACRIQSGTVWVNKHLDLPTEVPFSGAKQSGFGTEMGQAGLEEFTQSRIINLAK